MLMKKWEIIVFWFCIIMSILLSILSLLVFGRIRFCGLSAEVDGWLGAADVDGCGSTVVGVGAMSISDAAATSVEWLLKWFHKCAVAGLCGCCL